MIGWTDLIIVVSISLVQAMLLTIRTDRLNALNYMILQIIFQQLYILHTGHFKRRIVSDCKTILFFKIKNRYRTKKSYTDFYKRYSIVLF